MRVDHHGGLVTIPHDLPEITDRPLGHNGALFLGANSVWGCLICYLFRGPVLGRETDPKTMRPHFCEKGPQSGSPEYAAGRSRFSTVARILLAALMGLASPYFHSLIAGKNDSLRGDLRPR